ncbi:MAG: tetratricopeptide repeat protein [Terracidiphilus sp.]
MPERYARSISSSVLVASVTAGCILAIGLLAGFCKSVVAAKDEAERIAIDYPLNGSVFPPDMEAPTFLWRDSATDANAWRIDVTFANGSAALHVDAKGERMHVGEIDPRCISANNKLPELTPEQAAARTWKPDASTWVAIKKRAGSGAVTITIRGYGGAEAGRAVSTGAMQMYVSADAVNAPIFYRDVPLMPSETEKGFIKPLAANAVPLIAWRMRNVADAQSHVVMTGLHTCANCHSFAANGKTLGLDMDGPQNDKGLYALAPVAKKMTIGTENMVSWSKFRGEEGVQLRVGFMSQVSPDGRFVLTTIRPPGANTSQFYYVSNFKDYRFLQVFYPTRGILAWYDRVTKRLQPLPGADDPQYIQSNAVWSPDGKYLVFSRAVAKDPYRADGKMAAYANDPLEVQIQYDLYRIPFNGGKGGTPEPIAGASQNGMSNTFPKISPDGKWIVFVEAHNGQLMRPDGKLYIVPASGGVARRMNCNTPLMNSWHSFSPNGRWLVFSSKSRSPYTQMFLTHIDAEGNDTPAILIENSTAANRAVNIPEFVNMEPTGIEHIDTPAVDFYKQFDVAEDLAKRGQYAAAIPEWTKALAMEPNDAHALNNYGQTLARSGATDRAIAEFRKAIAVKPEYPEAENNLAFVLAGAGRPGEAIEHYRMAIEEKPAYAEARSNLGHVLTEQGNLDGAVEQFQQALTINPDYAAAHNGLGFALASANRLDGAADEYRRAIEADPKYADAYNNLGVVMARQRRIDEAIEDFNKAIELDPACVGAESNLGHALLAKDRVDEAIPHLARAVGANSNSAELHSDLGAALAERGRLDEAIPEFERALQISPNMVRAQSHLGMALVMKGRAAEGLAQWRKVLQEEPDNPRVLNDAAWLLATSPEGALRNGKEAVELARHAVQVTSAKEPSVLGTLAAAYGETGEFDKAIEIEQQARDLAKQQGEPDLAAEFSRRMALLQAHTPIREK